MKEGVNPNAKDDQGVPVLLRMVTTKNLDLISLYLSKGGNLQITSDRSQSNALHYAAHQGDLEMSKYLVSVGIDFKLQDKQGRKPVDDASSQHKLAVVQFLQEVEKRYHTNIVCYFILFLFYFISFQSFKFFENFKILINEIGYNWNS